MINSIDSHCPFFAIPRTDMHAFPNPRHFAIDGTIYMALEWHRIGLEAHP